MAEDMVAPLLSESDLWQQIDLSESYMVSGMCDEAATLSTSVVKQVRSATPMNSLDDKILAEVMESAGMVFVQSSKESCRTRELFDELAMLFGSVAAIPVQVFITGACLQISEGCAHNLKMIFEEFLENWIYVKDKEYIFPNTKSNSSLELWQSVIPVEKYMEVVDVYAITVLGMVLCKPGIAISWIHRAVLPEEKKQDILRRLHSLLLAERLSSSPGQWTESTNKQRDSTTKAGSPKTMELKITPKENVNTTYLKSTQPLVDHIPADRNAWLKLGNFPLVLPQRKIVVLSSLMLFTLYILRKKHTVLMRFLGRQTSSIRKALIDAWQLVFSVQVNPLAAVQ